MATGNFSKGTYKYPSPLIFYTDGHFEARKPVLVIAIKDKALALTVWASNLPAF